MRIHYIQHVPFEDAANIRPWAQDRGHSLSTTKIYEGQAFPVIDDFDWLVIMGGLMNVYQYRDYPWLLDEKKLIEQAIERQKLVLGVCLGAQMIADILGGRVAQNAYREIGWWPVTSTEQGIQSQLFADFDDTFKAFHWHGDMYTLPPDCVHLAVSEACPNQAFSYGSHVLGLQFHLEYTQESIEKMIANCADEMAPGPFVQSADQMRLDYPQIEVTKKYLFGLLDSMAAAAETTLS